jgi:diguanylate cyclase (GGDEF)-like protein
MYGAEPRAQLGAVVIVPLRDERREVIGALVAEWDDVAEQVASEGRNVRELAPATTAALAHVGEVQIATFTDQLTGLRNRRYFDEQLSERLEEAIRYQQPLALVVCDIDKFKVVNDSYGHEAGDEVLRQVARVFRDRARTADICARYGGEELVVLLPETGAEGARELAERLRQAVERRPVRHGGREISVTASFGVAAFPDCASTKDELFPAADHALYAAKSGGRNQVKVAPPKRYNIRH